MSEQGKSAPLVSVVMPAYNGERYIAQAIDSALEQTYRPMEIIVVDDGSTDSTAQKVAAYGEQVRCIHQENAGCPAARNAGIAAAGGEFIALLDDDDVWLPEKTAMQMSLFDLDASLGLVFTQKLYIDQNCNALDGMDPQELPPPVELVALEPGPGAFRIEGDLFESLLARCFLMPSMVIVRKSALQAVGGFDVSLPFVEDYDMWLRLAAEGVRFGWLVRPLIHRRRHPQSGVQNHVKVAQFRASLLEKLRRHPICRDQGRASAVRLATAGAHKSLGDYLAVARRMPEAREGYGKAMRTRFRPIHALNWLATWMGPLALPLMRTMNRQGDIFHQI